jgi:hypothetical protein
MPILQYIKNGTQYGFLKNGLECIYRMLRLEFLGTKLDAGWFYISTVMSQSKRTNFTVSNA